MDSSNRLKGILGQLSWKAEEVTAAEWVAIITHVIEEHRSLIAYLPGFKPAGELLNNYTGSAFNETDPKVITWCEGFSERVKSVSVAAILSQIDWTSTVGPNRIFRYAQEFEILLTIKGDLLLSDRKYENDYRGSTHYQVTKWWRFSRLSEEQLEKVMTTRNADQILNKIGELVQESVTNREAHLKSTQNFLDSLRAITSRIQDGPSGKWTLPCFD